MPALARASSKSTRNHFAMLSGVSPARWASKRARVGTHERSTMAAPKARFGSSTIGVPLPLGHHRMASPEVS
jgi:hypothetical protein